MRIHVLYCLIPTGQLVLEEAILPFVLQLVVKTILQLFSLVYWMILLCICY